MEQQSRLTEAFDVMDDLSAFMRSRLRFFHSAHESYSLAEYLEHANGLFGIPADRSISTDPIVITPVGPV